MKMKKIFSFSLFASSLLAIGAMHTGATQQAQNTGGITPISPNEETTVNQNATQKPKALVEEEGVVSVEEKNFDQTCTVNVPCVTVGTPDANPDFPVYTNDSDLFGKTIYDYNNVLLNIDGAVFPVNIHSKWTITTYQDGHKKYQLEQDLKATGRNYSISTSNAYQTIAWNNTRYFHAKYWFFKHLQFNESFTADKLDENGQYAGNFSVYPETAHNHVFTKETTAPYFKNIEDSYKINYQYGDRTDKSICTKVTYDNELNARDDGYISSHTPSGVDTTLLKQVTTFELGSDERMYCFNDSLNGTDMEGAIRFNRANSIYSQVFPFESEPYLSALGGTTLHDFPIELSKEQEPFAVVNYEEEKITRLRPDAQYSLDGNIVESDDEGKIAIPEYLMNNVHVPLIKLGRTGYTTDSDPTDVFINKRTVAPTVGQQLWFGNETFAGENDAWVKLFRSGLIEMRRMVEVENGENFWAPWCVPDKIIPNLSHGTYQFRRVADDVTGYFHGEALTIHIGVGVDFDAVKQELNNLQVGDHTKVIQNYGIDLELRPQDNGRVFTKELEDGGSKYGALGRPSTDSNKGDLGVVLSDCVEVAMATDDPLSNHATCYALKEDGTVVAWGYNGSGLLGTGACDSFIHESPKKIAGLDHITNIAAGNHLVAVKDDGTLWTLGKNDGFQLGREGDELVPHQVENVACVQKVVAGINYTAVELKGGTQWIFHCDKNGEQKVIKELK